MMNPGLMMRPETPDNEALKPHEVHLKALRKYEKMQEREKRKENLRDSHCVMPLGSPTEGDNKDESGKEKVVKVLLIM